jgi:hypothetical protein
MMRRIGSGSFRTSVGIATIWSSRASFGLRTRSMTSISYWPGRCFSHSRFRLSIAAIDFGDWPAT